VVGAALPRIVVAAPASGHGKTTVATGLMAALAARGLTVSGHKVGPDFIDPGYHALATGRPGRNLDPFMVGEQRVTPLLLHGARSADVAVIEGVMGLFDGRLGTGGEASTAHVASLTASPVLLVVDISHASRTHAAVVAGLAAFDPSVHIAGVILNKAGSQRHADEVRDALKPVAPELRGTPWDPAREVHAPSPARPVVAMAGGRAFTFRYAETEELLRAAGCDVVEFDPLTDAALPARTTGIYLGGGFPEVHATELAENRCLTADIRTAIAAGVPTVAECAGLLYLCRSLDGTPMVGAVPADAAMTPRLTLGYRTATSPADSLLAEAGRQVTGHEFHRTATTSSADRPAWQLPTGPEGFATSTLHAAYLHTHWAGHPALAQRFANAVHGVPSLTRSR
jgi:cobyrinic acid a,c-diamide synthase